MSEAFKSWLRREWEAVKKSGTMLLGWLTALGGALMAAAVDLTSDPNISGAIQSVLQPKYIPYYVIILGVLVRFVRKANAKDL